MSTTLKLQVTSSGGKAQTFSSIFKADQSNDDYVAVGKTIGNLMIGGGDPTKIVKTEQTTIYQN